MESAAFYGVHLGGAAPAHLARPAKKKVNRVTVCSGPGCPACGTLKAYLRQNNISFREIDIARDQQAAEKLIRRSGQEKPQEGEIIAVADDATEEVAVGDRVVYKKFSGTEVALKDKKYILLTADDLLVKYVAVDEIPE